MGHTIGVDVGGTKIAAGVVDEAGGLVALSVRPTPHHDAMQVEDAVVGVVGDLRRHHEATAVGIAAAGFLDADRATVRFAPHLVWRDEPLRAALSRRLQIPVVVENDANAAAWAEYRFGAGQGESDLVVLTLGTGIGAGIVRHGEIVRGRFGMAGEMGHLPLVQDGRPCPCGQRGCWERYVSGEAVAFDARERVAAEPDRGRRLVEGAGSVGAITGVHVTEAARAGDELSVEVLGVVGEWLGIGLVAITTHLDPGAYVIGGGLGAAGELLLTPAAVSYVERLPAATHRPVADLRLAALGTEAGLVGAADLARRATS
jgi:glucokinase